MAGNTDSQKATEKAQNEHFKRTEPTIYHHPNDPITDWHLGPLKREGLVHPDFQVKPPEAQVEEALPEPPPPKKDEPYLPPSPPTEPIETELKDLANAKKE